MLLKEKIMIKINMNMPKNCGECPFFQRLICTYGKCLANPNVIVYWSLKRDKKCNLYEL